MFCNTRTFLYERGRRLYSSLEGFNELGLSGVLTDKLNHKGITRPTEIQAKAIPRALQGRHVVINAETGSGKTLCFLLPIIHRQMNSIIEGTNDSMTNTSSLPVGLVLVPTPDLAHQISLVYKDYSTFDCTMLYGNRPLLLSPSVGLVVATPTSLLEYDLFKVLKNVGVVCCDEADILLTGGERKPAWKTLETVRKIHQRNVRFAEEDAPKAITRQLIFTAATLPTNSTKSVGRVLSQWLPKNTLFINTERKHCVVSSAEITFEDINDTMLPQVGGVREAELFDAKVKLLIEKFLNKGMESKNSIIFCNTVNSCQMLLDIFDSGRCDHINVSSLNKSVPPEERAKLLKEFNDGSIDVLVCTDLASRGIDTANTDQVIMFDFPVNAADFLHRAGRTARAGKHGRVIAFVMPNDQDLAMEVKNIIEEEKITDGSASDVSFNNIFSRNKMLRRRMRRRNDNEVSANS